MLDLLTSLLLAPQQAQADEDGLRYVRWACRRLQGGRSPRRSPFWPVYQDALEGLRRCQQGQWPPPLPPGAQQQQQQEPEQPAAQLQQQAPTQQQPLGEQGPGAAAGPGGGSGTPAAGAAVQPPAMPAMQSLCVIAGEVAEEMARTPRPQQEEAQPREPPPLDSSGISGSGAAPP